MPEQSPEPFILFEEQLPNIDRLIQATARRRRLSQDEGDEFRSFAYEHLLANGCAILFQYRGASRWTTFLTVVVQRLFLDFRDHRWGKWRPSAKARRRGNAGILLDQLLRRDGFGTDEAIRILKNNHGVELPEETLRRWAAELPFHGRPAPADEACLEYRAAPERTDAAVLEAESLRERRGVEELLEEALQALEAEDRLILRMRFLDGFKVSEISRLLDLPQKPLYRRIQADLVLLRTWLEEHGWTARELEEVFREV
ncbi:MAG: sigma-70 family RNA polymerase sigma factor [Acidobacteria bacterium]|nr:sigma-70 family RNA polymerase sigma factor [Acidobacteriota bacterium]